MSLVVCTVPPLRILNDAEPASLPIQKSLLY